MLANLIVGIAENIGDASVNIQNYIDAAQPVFARLFEILDEGGSQRGLIRAIADRFDGLGFIDLIDPERTGFQSRKRTSQRGVMAPNCGAVLVTFAS